MAIVNRCEFVTSTLVCEVRLDAFRKKTLYKVWNEIQKCGSQAKVERGFVKTQASS
jgi:hypothetical protein